MRKRQIRFQAAASMARKAGPLARPLPESHAGSVASSIDGQTASEKFLAFRVLNQEIDRETPPDICLDPAFLMNRWATAGAPLHRETSFGDSSCRMA